MQKIKVFFFQTDSAWGSHGLLTYASTSCHGGNDTLTTPCPKVNNDENYDNDDDNIGDKSKSKYLEKGQRLNVSGIMSELQS